MSTATDILQLIDTISGEVVTYRITNTWYDGTPLTVNDSRVDGVIYRKLGSVYYRKQIDDNTLVKINTINQLRNFNGYYVGQEISLLGYYASGDKPPIIYRFTTTNFDTLVDDGGTIIKTNKGIWIAEFENDSVDVRHYGIISTDLNSLDKWLKLNTYCVDNNKYIYLSINVNLVFSVNTEIYTANIKGNSSTLYLDGKVWFRTDNLLNVDMDGFDTIVKNNYTTLTSTNGSTTIFYCPKADYNANREVSYKNLTCNVEAPLYDGSNRLSGFIRDGSYNKGVYKNIVVTNVSAGVVTNTNQSSRNNEFENIIGYNFGTLVWAQGENQICNNIIGTNTPEQATKWANKNATPTPRLVNGFDVVLASGNGITLNNIRAINPIERVVYIQCNDVKADNLYSLNGDGIKFVGQSYTSICNDIYIDNVVLEFDSTSQLTFNASCFQIYWVDNYNLTNVIVNNSNTTTDRILNLYSFRRTAKNVVIKNITMKGRGCLESLGEFTSHEPETVGTIPYENIEISNVYGLRARGRKSSTFNHYVTTPTETLIKNIKINNCYVDYQKVSENGDDFLYRFDWIDGFTASSNSSNVRGQWVGGFPGTAPLSSYSNILIQEDNLKASNLESNIAAMNQGLNLLPSSYMNFEIVKGNNMKYFFKGTGLNYLEWRVNNVSSNTVTATGRTFYIEVLNKALGYTSCQIVSNVKTAITGVVPTTLVTYTDGATSVSVRGDSFSGSYDFKAKVFL